MIPWATNWVNDKARGFSQCGLVASLPDILNALCSTVISVGRDATGASDRSTMEMRLRILSTMMGTRRIAHSAPRNDVFYVYSPDLRDFFDSSA